jgi:serine/threonine protein kinase
MLKKLGFGGGKDDDVVPVPAPEPAPEVSGGGGAAGLTDEESPYFGTGAHKVDKTSFDMISVLGQGSFGQVILVRKKDTGVLYAMKVLQKKNLVARRQVEHTRSERNVLEQMAGVPFIVNVRYAFQTHDKLYLVLDFAQGGELFFHLKKLGRFNQRAVQFYAAQMVLALENVHKLDVIYRDLKPENVLLDKDGYICLTDFGLSKEGVQGDDEGTSTFCGTPEYLAPEVLKEGSAHGKAVDWWAMGTLLYEMLHGLPPFYSQNVAEMYDKIQNERLVFPKHFQPNTRSFLAGLLERDPAQRFDVYQIKAHPFFAGVDWDKLLNKEYAAPMVPRLRDELDLSYFDSQFTQEEPPTETPIEEGGLMRASVTGGMFEGFTFDQTAAEAARLNAGGDGVLDGLEDDLGDDSDGGGDGGSFDAPSVGAPGVGGMLSAGGDDGL